MPHDGHTHDHATTFQPDITEPSKDWEFLEIALRELLIEKGVVTAREIADMVEAWEQKSPEDGARIVAKAWVDPDFKARLLADGTAAVAELGFVFEGTELVVVENTDALHHMVVCTLCSCYPRPILGMPPLWYKSKEYRARRCASRGRCSPSSAPRSRPGSRCACSIRRRTCATSCCRAVPTAPTA